MRWLTRKGMRRSQLAAWGLRRLDVHPQRILTSPLLRARQTAEIVADVLGVADGSLVVTPALEPQRSQPSELWSELARLPDRSVLCVGHSPYLEQLLAAALGSARPTLANFERNAVAMVDFAYGPGQLGSLNWMMQAKTLRILGRRWLTPAGDRGASAGASPTRSR